MSLAILSFLCSGCSFWLFQEYESLDTLKRKLDRYQKVRTCSTSELSVDFWIKKPVTEAEEQLWHDDLKIVFTIKSLPEDIVRKISETDPIVFPIVFAWNYPPSIDPKTGDSNPRTLTDIVDIFENKGDVDSLPAKMLENRGAKHFQEKKERLEAKLKGSIKKLFENMEFYDQYFSFRTRFLIVRGILNPYYDLVDRCIYKF